MVGKVIPHHKWRMVVVAMILSFPPGASVAGLGPSPLLETPGHLGQENVIM